MKKYTEYKRLTPLEVAEIGERDGWPIKGLALSDDGEKWQYVAIENISMTSDEPFISYGVLAVGWKHGVLTVGWKYCARPIERIKWEIGDTVQTPKGVKGKIQRIAENNWFYISDSNETTPPFCALSKKYELKPWKPEYGYTENGELIKPQECYEIVPEGESLPYTGKLFQHGAWHEYKLDGNEQNNFAQLKFDVRAYARKIEPEEQTAYNWFRQALPRKVANRIINKVSAHELDRKYKSAANALWCLFDWDETPERADYWIDWYEWLAGYLEEMPSIEPPIAEGRNSADATSNETPKMGQVWHWVSSGADYLIIHDSETSEGSGRNRQWNLTDNKPAFFNAAYMPYLYWEKVADSLDEYYAAKQQPTVTPQ